MQADDGYVYPLERAFFYVQKPPLLLVFDDIDSLEFMRQAQGRPWRHTAPRGCWGQHGSRQGLPAKNLGLWLLAKC